MKTFKKLKEDIEVTDKTGKALNVAQQYIKTYKNTRRPTPEIIKKGMGKFTLKGKDEDLVVKSKVYMIALLSVKSPL